MGKAQNMAEFMGCDFSKFLKVFVKPASGPTIVKYNIPFEDTNKRWLIKFPCFLGSGHKPAKGQNP